MSRNFFFSTFAGYLAFKRLRNLDVTKKCEQLPVGLCSLIVISHLDLNHSCELKLNGAFGSLLSEFVGCTIEYLMLTIFRRFNESLERRQDDHDAFELSQTTISPYIGLCLNITDHSPSICTKTELRFRTGSNNFDKPENKLSVEYQNPS